MDNGWISVHRKLKEKGFYHKSQYIHLWIHLLLTANHKPTKFFWNGEEIEVHRGQLITGRKELSIETGIPETTIERILKCLENGHQIGQQKTTKYRLITIQKYEDYQSRTSKRTTSGQQADTNNKNNNVITKGISKEIHLKDKNMKNSFKYNENQHTDTFEDVIDLDTGSYQKPKNKVAKNKVAFSLIEIFTGMCEEKIKVKPVQDKKSYFIVLNALKHLSPEEIVELWEQWFKSGKEKADLISITASLSTNSINRFKTK